MAKNWVLVGTIGKAYGIKGWVKINSYTEPTSNILTYHPWHLAAPHKENSPFTMEIINYQSHHGRLTVQFAGCQTSESAALLTNHKIYVERQALSPLTEGEYYWVDLIGLKVYTRKKIYLGVIVDILATGSNDVLVVVDQNRYLIPFLLEQTIKSINLEQKTMLVDWDPAC